MGQSCIPLRVKVSQPTHYITVTASEASATNADFPIDSAIANSSSVIVKGNLSEKDAVDKMTLFGGLCYDKDRTIQSADGFRRWPEPTPWFRDLLANFKHDPVEWNTPRYRKYRRNQMAKAGVNSWPADLELCFQRALRLFGGYGRDKQRLGTKLSGCNEWIAWCIFVESGTELSRKQVSSHLQVLKKLLQDNIPWMLFARPLFQPYDRIDKRKHRRREKQQQQQSEGNEDAGVDSGCLDALKSKDSTSSFEVVLHPKEEVQSQSE